jgi:hypothetical protein
MTGVMKSVRVCDSNKPPTTASPKDWCAATAVGFRVGGPLSLKTLTDKLFSRRIFPTKKEISALQIAQQPEAEGGVAQHSALIARFFVGVFERVKQAALMEDFSQLNPRPIRPGGTVAIF